MISYDLETLIHFLTDGQKMKGVILKDIMKKLSSLYPQVITKGVGSIYPIVAANWADKIVQKCGHDFELYKKEMMNLDSEKMSILVNFLILQKSIQESLPSSEKKELSLKIVNLVRDRIKNRSSKDSSVLLWDEYKVGKLQIMISLKEYFQYYTNSDADIIKEEISNYPNLEIDVAEITERLTKAPLKFLSGLEAYLLMLNYTTK